MQEDACFRKGQKAERHEQGGSTFHSKAPATRGGQCLVQGLGGACLGNWARPRQVPKAAHLREGRLLHWFVGRVVANHMGNQ